VYLVSAASTTITHTVAHTFYEGAYPVAPLTDAANGPWRVAVKVFFTSPSPVAGTLTISGNWSGSATASSAVALPAGDSDVTLNLTALNVPLWWPNGMGAHPLFAVSVRWDAAGGDSVQDSRSVGFRTFVVVTADDSDPSTLAGGDGSGNLTMRFRVNGGNMWARGGNMIPMEELEGRLSADAYRYLVRSAAAAGFNTMRVWGGGIYPPTVFFDECDANGILLYHDIMYAQGGHSPAATPTQDAEIRHQVRRISSHPSLALIDFCNE